MERSWKQGSARSTEVAFSVLDRGRCTGSEWESLCKDRLHGGAS